MGVCGTLNVAQLAILLDVILDAEIVERILLQQGFDATCQRCSSSCMLAQIGFR